MTTDARLDLEFAYTSLDESCRDLYDFSIDDERFCRRPRGHEPGHACGFGQHRKRWES